MAPSSDILPFSLLILRHSIPFVSRILFQKLYAIYHSLTYRAVPDTKVVVIIGASYAGLHVARRLTQTLPTGYKVVLIERNEDMHWVFAFPRYSVLEGYEEAAFVPCGQVEKGAVQGILERVRGRVMRVSEGDVVVQRADGEEQRVKWDYLVVATGCEQGVPARLGREGTAEAVEVLRGLQRSIKSADKIAVVGGGAVGVELVADVKDVYPEKEVWLVHSRATLLNAFGERLHERAMERLNELGVKIVLGQRPAIHEQGLEGQAGALTFEDGTVEGFDLVVGGIAVAESLADAKQIPCTGQKPNSSMIQEAFPDAVSKQTRRVLVNKSLQICGSDEAVPNYKAFALGDVAETGAPKMARATMMQGEVVVDNILSMINHGKTTATYTPQLDIEGTIKLTLGLKDVAIWIQDPRNGRELMITSNKGHEDMDVAMGWNYYGPGKKHMPKRGQASSK